MKSVLKLTLAAAAALAVNTVVVSGARAQAVGPTIPATAPTQVIGAQYGYAAFTETLIKSGAIVSSIEINGPAALAIYHGMKDVPEGAGAVANTKVRNGQNISCTLAPFEQALCTVSFETLPAGKFVTTH